MTFRTQLRPKDLSLEEKLFFTELPFFQELDILMDVGCGPHAHVSHEAAKRSRKDRLIVMPVDPNYVMKPEEQHLARNLFSWSDVIKGCTASSTGMQRAVLFSSVLHEMFSIGGHYGKPAAVQFWKDAAGTGAEYVIVRDMCFQCDPRTLMLPAQCHMLMDAMETALSLALMGGLPKVYTDAIVDRVNETTPLGKPALTSQTILREYLQMLLQAQWGDKHMAAEMKEHYFALDAAHFDAAAQSVGYSPIHLRHYTPDHFKVPGHPAYKVFDPRGYPPQANITTHIEAVYKKDHVDPTRTIH